MIKNGYYYPVELYEKLMHIDQEGNLVGEAQMGISFGNRTGGKTVGHGIQLLKDYDEKRERCMLLSRTMKQKDRGYLENWWRKILNVNDDEGFIEYFKNKYEITFSKDVMKVGGDVLCYCEAISASMKVKDEGSYNTCTKILMDEAVQEGESFLRIEGRPAMSRIYEIWTTVARGYPMAKNRTNLIFIANISNRDNWVFSENHINDFVRVDTKFTCQRGICVDIVMNEKARLDMEESIMGQIIRGSESGKSYYEAAFNNEYQDNTAFISPIGLNFKNLCVQFVIHGVFLGVFKTETGFHVSKINEDSRSEKITNDVKLHTDSIKFEMSGKWEVLLREMYVKGLVTFQSLESKNLFIDFARI